MQGTEWTDLPDVRAEVLEAEQRIRNHIIETPVDFSPYLSRVGNCRVYLKLENVQVSGSFKVRGAVNKYLSLSKEARAGYLVTASSGNHGAAFGYTLDRFGGRGVIYLPEVVSQTKLDALRIYNVDLQIYGDDGIKSETLAKETARKNNQVFISPYNDSRIIGGQGTIGVELLRQIEHIDVVLVPVGGGGLISGIAGYLKSVDKNIEIIGCQPEHSKVMYESLKAGRLLELPSKPTISDGTAGGIEPEAITFEYCRRYVDDFIIANEDEIKNAIRLLVEKHYMVVEGAAALQVASFLKARERFADKAVVLIISGKKIGLETLKQVLCEGGS